MNSATLPVLSRPESLMVIFELISYWGRVISLINHQFVMVFTNQQVSGLRMLHSSKGPTSHAPPAIQFVGEELISSHVDWYADGAENLDEADGYISIMRWHRQARGHTSLHPCHGSMIL